MGELAEEWYASAVAKFIHVALFRGIRSSTNVMFMFCVSFNNLLISLSCRTVGKETALDS